MVRNHNDSSNLEDDLISSDVDYECYSLRICDNNDMSIEAVFAAEEILLLHERYVEEFEAIGIKELFGKIQNHRRLEGLREFLSNYDGEICAEFLSLDGLHPALAKVLATYKGRLSISVDSLSRESAQALSNHTGLLEIDGLMEITTGVAAALARHKGTLELELPDSEDDWVRDSKLSWVQFVIKDSGGNEAWPNDFYSDYFEAAVQAKLFSGDEFDVGTQCLEWFVRLKSRKKEAIKVLADKLSVDDELVHRLLTGHKEGLHLYAWNPNDWIDDDEEEQYREEMFERLVASLEGLKGHPIRLNQEDCEGFEEKYFSDLFEYGGSITYYDTTRQEDVIFGEVQIARVVDQTFSAVHKDECDEEYEEQEDDRGLVERIRSQKVEELESMIGLDEVKSEVKQLIDFLEVQRERKRLGKKNISISNHLVFSGNPGTGKTTVARIVGAIYHSMGFLSSGHVVEVSRSDLCGVFVGETGPKTLAKCEEAKGGVLFIDEAYSLVRDTISRADYGAEAIDELLKFMEDNREDFVVIVAGYPEKMLTFIDSNPGLKSRFNKTISFADYSPKELLEILAVNCKNADYQLTSEAQDFVQKMYEQSCRDADEQFGNARDVRNRFEAAIKKQASRIVGDESADHSILLPEDFQPWFVS